MKLYNILIIYFNISELEELCFELGINHEFLVYNEIASFANAIIKYCHEKNLTQALTLEVARVRPFLKERINE